MARDPTGLARNWRCPPKTLCSVYIRAAPLIGKNCDLEWQWFSYVYDVSHGECQWSVRSTFCSCPCVNTVIHWYERWQNCIHAAAGPERSTQTVFSTTHHYFSVNNRSTREGCTEWSPTENSNNKIKSSFGVWPNKREDRINCTGQWRDTIK